VGKWAKEGITGVGDSIGRPQESRGGGERTGELPLIGDCGERIRGCASEKEKEKRKTGTR